MGQSYIFPVIQNIKAKKIKIIIMFFEIQREKKYKKWREKDMKNVSTGEISILGLKLSGDFDCFLVH